LISGRYQELENGLARDTELDRVVRLRWVDSATEVDDPRLSHPNVVRVFDIGEHDGRRFAAVEHVQGLPLALVAPLAVSDAVTLGLQACRALAAAHDLGLVHEGEILVRHDGVPKLAGFRRGRPGADVRGLAEALGDAAPDLPPLTADTPTGLALELERARPTAPAPTIPFAAVESGPPPQRRRPLAAVLAAVALVAVAVGVIAAIALGGGGADVKKPVAPQVARVQPVAHSADAEQQARNIAAWLSRYSR
jgi:hypothetical protein